uniref:Putative secreted protein n=1 Tax=Amblyomma triste TaxID=251400 RepID=A0A023GB98_AMBTT
MGRLRLSAVCIFVTCLLGVSRAQLKPGCSVSQLHACGEDYLVYSNTTRQPEPDEEQFQINCELYSKQIACTVQFAEKCLENVPRAVALVAMEAAGEDFEAACTEGTDRYDLYKDSIKCLNNAGVQLNSCFGLLRGGLAESVGAPQGRTIHYACCAYHSSLECVESSLDSVCGSSSTAKDYVTNVMERIFGQVLSLVCGPYTKGSADCDALPKLPPQSSAKKTNLIELVIEITNSFRNKKKKN